MVRAIVTQSLSHCVQQMSSSHRRNLSARFSRKADVMMKDMLQNALAQMRSDLVDSDSDDDNNDDDDEWD